MKGLVLLAAVFALNSFSATTTPTTTTTVSASADAKVLLGGELRPTTAFNGAGVDSSYASENNVLAGYQFDKNTWLYYRQDFNANLSNSAYDGVKAADGSLRGGLKNIWTSGNWSLNYEGRAYVPTSSASADSGMISQLRNYGILNYKMNDAWTVYVQEGPTLDFYSQDVGVRGVNPNFDNRTYVGANWKVSDKMIVLMPLKMVNSHLRAGAGWTHRLYINPEVFYNLNKNLYLGAGVETASFVSPTFGDLSIGKGFEASKAYVVVGASL